MIDVGPAIGAVHVRKRLVPPPGVEGEHSLLGFLLASVSWGDVHQIDGQNVGNQDFRGMTAAFSVGLILGGEVLAEGSLGARAIFWSAARADLARSISNDPNCALSEGTIGISVLGAKPETDAFCGTRHNALISSMAASVVKSLPATRSITSRPFAASLRNPLAVIDPSGNASAAAISSRSGVFGWILCISGSVRTMEATEKSSYRGDRGDRLHRKLLEVVGPSPAGPCDGPTLVTAPSRAPERAAPAWPGPRHG